MLWDRIFGRKEIPDYRGEAEALFRSVAKEFGLKVEKMDDSCDASSMKIPRQGTFKYDLFLHLGDIGDELNFSVGDFHCEMFPFPEVKTLFTEYLRGALSGDYRIAIHRFKWMKCYSSELQKPTDSEWETVYGYSYGIGLEFLFKRWSDTEILHLNH